MQLKPRLKSTEIDVVYGASEPVFELTVKVSFSNIVKVCTSLRGCGGKLGDILFFIILTVIQ